MWLYLNEKQNAKSPIYVGNIDRRLSRLRYYFFKEMSTLRATCAPTSD